MKTGKRFLSIILVVLMLLTAAPLAGFVGLEIAPKAKALDESGQCGENVFWSFDSSSGTLMISGTGAMADYSDSDDSPFYKNSEIISVILGGNVTRIGERCFTYCDNLSSVEIPDSVKSIGNCAFQSCNTLISVTIPDSVTSIGKYAFYGCYSLISVVIGNSVVSIGEKAFYECSSLTSITIPDSVMSIGSSAFAFCRSLTEVTIGKKVNSIDKYVFSNCQSLNEITVDANNDFFSNNNHDGVLYNKNKTTLIEYPIGNLRESFSIPLGVTDIGEGAFAQCKHLKSVTIPNSVTTIWRSAFAQCTNLTNIEIGNGVTSIGDSTFYNCVNLTNVTIPQRVTIIGDSAFCMCESLTMLTIPGSVTRIGNKAFLGCIGLINITIPDSVTYIGASAFFGCDSLTSITFSNKLTTINEWLCSGCDNLKSVIIPNSVSSIQKWAFEDCDNLTNITIPTSVTNISYGVFSYCNSLQNVYYQGTKEQWNQIYIGTSNESLEDATIHFNSYYPGYVLYFIGTFEGYDTSTSWDGNPYISRILVDGVWRSVAEDLITNETEAEELINYKVRLAVNNNKIIEIEPLYDATPCKIYYYEDEGLASIKTDKSIDYYVTLNPSTTYSPQLARMLMGFSDAAYDVNRLIKSLKSHGFEKTVLSSLYDETSIYFDLYGAYSISTKTMSNGETLVLIAIRGTDLANLGEDLGDFAALDGNNLLGTGPHPIFNYSMNYIYNQLVDYFNGTLPKSNTKYLITGHSRGAAIGNLLAKRLLDEGVAQSNVYDYNFACPDVAIDADGIWNENNRYGCIYNICCFNDPVPFLPGKIGNAARSDILFNAHWGKYGVTKWFAYNWNDYRFIEDGFCCYHYPIKYIHYTAKLLDLDAMLSTDNLPSVDLYKNLKKIIIECPVDVTLYDENNHKVVSVINDKVVFHNTSTMILASSVNGEKTFLIPDDFKCSISLQGTDTGTMSIITQTVDVDEQTVCDGITYENIALTDGKTFRGIFQNSESASDLVIYCTNEDGKYTAVVNTDGTESSLQETCVHQYTHQTTKESTCTSDGVETFTCSLCGFSYTETIPALGHTDDNNDGHCDRCGEQMTGGDHCKFCGKIHNGGFFDKLTGFFHKIFAIFKR